MRDDGPARVDQLAKFPGDAERVDRIVLRSQQRHRLLHPRLLLAGDGVEHILLRRKARLRQHGFHRLHQLMENHLGIAQQRDVGRPLLVHLVGVDVDLDHLERNRKLVVARLKLEAAADGDDDICILGTTSGVRRCVEPAWPAPDADAQRVVVGEAALAGQGDRHRHRQQLGQLQQLGAGVGDQHTVPGVEQRTLRFDQHARRRLERRGVGARAQLLRRQRFIFIVADFLASEVARHFDDDWRGAPGTQQGEYLAHDLTKFALVVNPARPLGHRRVHRLQRHLLVGAMLVGE